MKPIARSHKLDNVCYEIRGPALLEAKRLEEDGHSILKLNTGNLPEFGLLAPDEILHDVIHNLPASQGYGDSKGLYSARKAVMQHYQEKQVRDVDIEDIYLGNGVSELIVMTMQALLNDGDEMLIPAPDYPLWTAAVSLSGGTPVHYICDEEDDWNPNIEDIRSRITPKTRGIVVINPNNPTGALYPKSLLLQIIELAREHQLIIFADEIYDKILYDDAVHTPMASLVDDLVCISFNGLSKAYRVAGFRSGWMLISGAKHLAKDYIEGLNILATMRLCANVPAQHAIQTCLGGYQSINELTEPGGYLYEQRQVAWQGLNNLPGVTCVKPKGALYLFPKIDTEMYRIDNDEQFILDLLLQEKILMVQGSGFNWPGTDHFRLIFLPRVEALEQAIDKIGRFLQGYKR